jgi:hypothetical protein
MKTLTVLGFSVVCAVLLVLFSQIEDLLKYLFSLAALYIGVQFFKRYESRGMRITFVVSTIVLYFIIAVGYAFYVAISTGMVPSNV